MKYAYETEQGQQALAARNRTADYYACIHGLKTAISPNPLDPLPVYFLRNGRLDSLAIIRNRSERLSSFPWSSIILTASKVDMLKREVILRNVNGLVIVRMADDALLSWRVGPLINYPRGNSITKGDCLGSHFVERENVFLPLDRATVVTPDQLV